MNMNKLNLIPLSLAGLTILTGTILASSIVSADDDTSVVDQINITVPVSCTLSGTGMNTHNAEISNGQYNSAIGETTLKAFCNDNEGFAIYAIGYTDNEEGKNVLTNSTLGSTYDITTGTAITGNDSKWAMKLTKLTSPTPTYPIIIAGSTEDSLKEQGDPDYSTFQEVPDDYEKVAYRTSATDTGTNAEGATLTTTYQAYISKTQPAGTYTGQVKYTLVHPHDTAAPLIPISIEDALNAAGKTKYNGYYKIQDIASTICANANQYGSDGIAEVIDVRDNNIYHIAKLADNNCWMLDNLALDPTDSTTAANMSAANTNATAEAISNYLNGGSVVAGWSRYEVSGVISHDPDYYTMWFNQPFINNQSLNTLVTSYGPASVNNQAKVGIYYNYCAASVGTYCYSIEADVDLPDTIIDAPQDVCPANWRMPTGGSTGEYTALSSYYDTAQSASNSASLQYNLSTSLSGLYYYYSSGTSNHPIDQESNGYWWSSTRSGPNTIYILSATSGLINPSQGSSREKMYTIRCLVSN